MIWSWNFLKEFFFTLSLSILQLWWREDFDSQLLTCSSHKLEITHTTRVRSLYREVLSTMSLLEKVIWLRWPIEVLQGSLDNHLDRPFPLFPVHISASCKITLKIASMWPEVTGQNSANFSLTENLIYYYTYKM